MSGVSAARSVGLIQAATFGVLTDAAMPTTVSVTAGFGGAALWPCPGGTRAGPPGAAFSAPLPVNAGWT